MSEPTPIGDAKSKKVQSSRAEEMEAHAALLVSALGTSYRLLLDDQEEGIVAAITEPGVLKVISREAVLERSIIRMMGKRATVGDLRSEVYPRWLAEMRVRQELCLNYMDVKPFVFKSEPLAAGWAWQRLPWDPDENAVCPPTFAEICQRTSLEEARALTLYLGSLFDYGFPRSQYLYLEGPGGDGKSRIIEAAERMFAKQGYTTMGADDLGDSHSTSALEGVRLLTFPDINKPGLPSTGIFKQLTGDDTMGVNPKMRQRRNIKLDCKVIISSNHPPKLNGGPADLRRLIYIRLKKHEAGADHGFIERCKSEAPQWAQYCYSQYLAWRKLNPIGDLPTSDEALESVRADSAEGSAQSLIEECLIFHKDYKISAQLLQTNLQRLTRGNYALEQTVYAMLKQRPNCRKARLPEKESPTRAPVWHGVDINPTARDK